jgi:hypothetical protein
MIEGMMNTTPTTPLQTQQDAPVPSRTDPLLQELWGIKAQMNKDAGYDVRRLYAQVQQAAVALFDRDGRVCVPAH